MSASWNFFLSLKSLKNSTRQNCNSYTHIHPNFNQASKHNYFVGTHNWARALTKANHKSVTMHRIAFIYFTLGFVLTLLSSEHAPLIDFCINLGSILSFPQSVALFDWKQGALLHQWNGHTRDITKVMHSNLNKIN